MDRTESREELSPECSSPKKALPAIGECSQQRSSPREIVQPPCFFSGVCRQRAAIEKAGRPVCRGCADTRIRGAEYPLRDATSEPLYLTGRVASEALDMVEDVPHRARRGLRGDSWS